MAAPVSSLLLWGGVDEAGVPFLEPAFVVDATPTLPDSAGEQRITGWTSGGGKLFSFSFQMPEDPHGEDLRAGFVFALPVRPGWANALASITLSGPAGSFTLDRETDRPMAILRDRFTGHVRGVLRDLPAAAQVAPGTLRRAPPNRPPRYCSAGGSLTARHGGGKRPETPDRATCESEGFGDSYCTSFGRLRRNVSARRPIFQLPARLLDGRLLAGRLKSISFFSL